jgi:carbon storage regulator
MLVLTRHITDQIVISGNIVITVVDIQGDKVRLGIEAPRSIPVHRREVQDQIDDNLRQLEGGANSADQL